MSSERVFNPRQRWLLRKHIRGSEIVAGVSVLMALAVMLGWVVAQKDNYIPADRDLPFEMLAQQPVEDRLYRTPLKPWRPPGTSEGARANVELGWFPPTLLQDGWALASRPRRFLRDNLFEKINGEAEKFIRQGFRELQYLSLKAPRGNDELSVELFDQGAFPGALGLFADHRGPGRPIRHEGDVMFFTTPAGAIGMNGNFFFRIAGNGETDAIRNKAVQVVKAFAGLPTERQATPLEFIIFTRRLGVDPGSVTFQKQNVFQYDFARDFWFAKLRPESPTKLFVHRATTPQAAGVLFGEILTEHGFEYKVLQATDNQATLRHPFLNTHFRIKTSESWVYGVENEPEAARLDELMRRLEKALTGKG